MHEKLVPSLESAEHVDVCGLVELPTLLISSTFEPKVEITPLVVLSVAALVPLTPVISSPKRTVPKSASGRIPPLLVQHGASVIHSAEERAAPRTLAPLL